MVLCGARQELGSMVHTGAFHTGIFCDPMAIGCTVWKCKECPLLCYGKFPLFLNVYLHFYICIFKDRKRNTNFPLMHPSVLKRVVTLFLAVGQHRRADRLYKANKQRDPQPPITVPSLAPIPPSAKDLGSAVGDCQVWMPGKAGCIIALN